VIIEQKILWLEVAVHNVHHVDLLHTSSDLVEEAASLGFGHAATGYNEVEQLTTTSILHDEVELPARFYNLVQLNNVWVPDELQYMNLTSNPFYISYLDDPLLFQHLHCNSFTSQNVGAQLYLAKCALPNRFAEDVMPDGLGPSPCMSTTGGLFCSAMACLRLRRDCHAWVQGPTSAPK